MEVFTRFKLRHPFVKVGMGIGFADEEEIKAVEHGAATEGLVGVEVVAQDGVVSCVVEGAVVLQPPFGGIDFTVLLLVSVLGEDELRAQRDGIGLAGAEDDRRDCAVIMGQLSILTLQRGAVRAVNVFGLRGEIPGAVQSDETGAVDAAEIIEKALFLQGLINTVVNGKEFLGLHRIEHVADMLGCGDLVDLEEALSVASALVLFHGLLVGQEGRALGEEDRKGAQGDILHRVLDVASGAPIRKVREALPKLPDQLIEALEAHAQSLRWKSAPRG